MYSVKHLLNESVQIWMLFVLEVWKFCLFLFYGERPQSLFACSIVRLNPASFLPNRV
jgi:hypothetical protein